MLVFGGMVVDFIVVVEVDCLFQCMMSFVFVEFDLGMLLEFGIQNLVDYEQGVFDVIDFLQGCCEFVLLWIGGEFLQNLVWCDGFGSNGGGDVQDVGLIVFDYGLVDFFVD